MPEDAEPRPVLLAIWVGPGHMRFTNSHLTFWHWSLAWLEKDPIR